MAYPIASAAVMSNPVLEAHKDWLDIVTSTGKCDPELPMPPKSRVRVFDPSWA